MDRHRVGLQQRLVFRVPLAAQRGDFLDPGCALLPRSTCRSGRASPPARVLASPSTLACKRIIAAERFRLDVDLDRRRADLRHRPEMRGHAAGLGADEADQIGAVDGAVGALARIAADDADRQRMRAGDRVLAVERGGDRNLQRFRQRHQFARRARGAHAAAGDDDRPLGLLQQIERRLHMRRFRRRAGTAARARIAPRPAAPSRLPRDRPGPRCRGIADAPARACRRWPCGTPAAACRECAPRRRRWRSTWSPARRPARRRFPGRPCGTWSWDRGRRSWRSPANARARRRAGRRRD